jgi:hypothetical protein
MTDRTEQKYANIGGRGELGCYKVTVFDLKSQAVETKYITARSLLPVIQTLEPSYEASQERMITEILLLGKGECILDPQCTDAIPVSTLPKNQKVEA